MHSSPPPPVADEHSNLHDEEAIVYLMMLHEKSPLPPNVVQLNPYLCRPEHLPGGMWFCYRVCSAERKRAEFGYWREKEAASEIFTNSDITGSRTSYEFIEVGEGPEEGTKWSMHEYTLTKKGIPDDNGEKESEALCKVFHSDGPSSSGFHNFRFERGEYLELDDLAEDLSHSSSSLNTSRTSLTFDEQYFDADALLLELDSAAPDQTLQESGLGETESVKPVETESVKSVETVLQPATSAGVEVEPKPDEKEGDVPGSSSSNGKKKAADAKMKGLKKYLCMIAF